MTEVEYDDIRYEDEDDRCAEYDDKYFEDEYGSGSDYSHSSSRDDTYRERERDRDRSHRKERERSRDSSSRRRESRNSRSDRDRDRDRDHDRSRNRNRRDYERDRSGDRFEGSSRRSESSDTGYGSTNGQENRDDSKDDRAGERWVTKTPTNTILLRGLPSSIDEKDLGAEVMLFGAPIKDVRLMRRSTGASRGFAFVEFQYIADAQRWMEQNQKKLYLLNEYETTMHYSTPKNAPEKNALTKNDWSCCKCGVHNFKRRNFCFKCGMSRDESEKNTEMDGYDQIGSNPCNTLLFRGLDALTTEESLIQALSRVSGHTLKNAHIIRDEMTNTSRGFAFVEFTSVQDSTSFMTSMDQLNPPLEVDGKQVVVSFAKNTFSTVMATLQQQIISSTQQGYEFGTQEFFPNYYQASSFPQGFDQSTIYSQNSQFPDMSTIGDYTAYFSNTNQSPASSGITTTAVSKLSTNNAAAVAQAAIQQAQAAKHYCKQTFEKHKGVIDRAVEEQTVNQNQELSQSDSNSLTTTTTTTTSTATSDECYTVYPAPDVSTFQFDETSGYYFDPSTSLYYDANTQYFYNSVTSQFLYWDAERSTYLPAPTDAENQSQDGTIKEDATMKKEKDKDKKEKVKTAKKIAKDMEKWAKTLNAQKDSMKDGFKKTFQPLGNFRNEKESATADAGYAILEKTQSKAVEQDKKLMPPPPPMSSNDKATTETASALVASYGGDSDESDEEDQLSGDNVQPIDETKFADWNKIACLLCKRGFQTKEILIKHNQMSEMHKQNLEALQKSRSGSIEEKNVYRDRAKERRDKYGAPAPPEPRKRPEVPVVAEQPTKDGIREDNIGNKLLQKMGWSEGQGLGKKGQGIVDPVEARRRNATAGLGARGSTIAASASDSYKEAAKKTMFARYNEIE